jgi:hypothetical protein
VRFASLVFATVSLLSFLIGGVAHKVPPYQRRPGDLSLLSIDDAQLIARVRPIWVQLQ